MKKEVVFVFIVIGILIVGSSCRKDFEYSPSQGRLSFSRDTVFLDTVFSTIGSSTYTLKVYNQSSEDVVIPSINLEKGIASNYRLNVDGATGDAFMNVPLNAKDSLFIFIETTVNFESDVANTLLYTDAIQFDNGENQQTVELVTLVQDATFLFPRTNDDGTKETITLNTNTNGNELVVQGFVLDENQLVFSNEKPYVIYGYAVVPDSTELIMDAGTRIYFHKDSGIFVQSGAAITINGVLSEDSEQLGGEVIFEGDRLEPEFSDVPGQWGAVWISEGSKNNTINHLTIKNASIGLYIAGDAVIDEPTLTIKNSQIYNSSAYNMFATSAFITAENLALGSAGVSSLHCQLGGNYSFIHSTIANYWNKGFRNTPTLLISNFNPLNRTDSRDLVKADFKNCIIDGANPVELSLNTNGQNTLEYNFTNCILKFNDTEGIFSDDPLYDFESSNNYSAIILNGEADFFLPSSNDLRIGLDSDAVNSGNTTISSQVPLDILGNSRISSSDLGAYQGISKE